MNFICKFEYRSGLSEHIFCKQFQANSAKSVIIEAVAYFLDVEPKGAELYILEKLQNSDWQGKDFFENFNETFYNEDETEAYHIYWLKEVPFDLDKI